MFAIKNKKTGEIVRKFKTNRLNRVKAMLEGPIVQMVVATEWARDGKLNHTALWEVAQLDKDTKKEFDKQCDEMLKNLVIEEVEDY